MSSGSPPALKRRSLTLSLSDEVEVEETLPSSGMRPESTPTKQQWQRATTRPSTSSGHSAVPGPSGYSRTRSRTRRTSSSSTTTSTSYSEEHTPRQGKEQTATRALSLSVKGKDIGEAWKQPGHLWAANFSNHALLTRIALEPGSDVQVLNKVPPAIISVKQFFLSAGTIVEKTYKVTVKAGLNQGDFNRAMQTRLNQFPEVEEAQLGPLWPDLKKGLAAMRLKMVENQVENKNIYVWQPLGVSSLSDLDTDSVLSELCIGFASDMQKGEAKGFFVSFSSFLAQSMGVGRFLKVSNPVVYDSSNTKVELLSAFDEANFMRSYTHQEPYQPSEMKRSDSEREDPTWPLTNKVGYQHQKAKMEIPDVVWSTMETNVTKGEFLLVVEMKPDAFVNEAVFQCYKQLLSKMHFQTFGFGLVVTPNRFVQIAGWKEKNEMRFYDSSMTFRGNMGEEEDHDFEMDNFIVMAKWLGRILQYAKAKKTKAYESKGRSTKVTSQSATASN